MSVQGLRMVITGGAVGIGAGTARLAASRGAKVVISDLNDEAGEALAQEIRDAGGEAVYRHCDVTDDVQVKALMASAADAFGGIDVLHNNVGINRPGDPVSMSEADWDSMRPGKRALAAGRQSRRSILPPRSR